MKDDTPILEQQQTLAFARSLMQAALQEHLPLTAEGYKCSTETLLDVLLTMAATGETLEAACAELHTRADAEAYRRWLRTALTLDRLDVLEAAINEALQAAVPAEIRQRISDHAHDIACDLSDFPYYGKADAEQALYVRSKARVGTTRFHRLATAYLILDKRRFTLAVHFVRPEETTLTVLKQLLDTLASWPLALGLVLLDKGFCSIEVLRYLSRNDYAAILACPIRGKKATAQRAAGGTRALCTGRKSYRSQHTFRGKQGRCFTAEVVVCRRYTTAGRTGRMARRAVWLVYVVIACRLSPAKVARRYLHRFGIETSYRLTRQVRARTTSPNPVYRFLLLGLSVVLVSVWLHLRWLLAQIPRRGGRALDEALLRLSRFRRFIVRAAEQKYGCCTEVYGHAPPLHQSWIY